MFKSTFNYSLFVLAGLLLQAPASAQQPGTVRWKVLLDYPDPGNYLCSPAIGPDGTIYVSNGNERTPTARALFAISPQGTTNWIFWRWGNLRSSPAIAPDGTIYVGCYDQNLYSLRPAGTTNWAFRTAGWLPSSPALGADGTIYINAVSNKVNKLYAVNPDGTAKWVFSMLPVASVSLPAQFSSPAIGPDGTIYVGSVDTNLYAINPDGTPKWARSLGAATFSSPSIGADGTIYIGSDNGFHAFAPEGVERWSLFPRAIVESSAAIGGDGTLYVSQLFGRTYALTPQGTPRWTVAPGFSASPALAADGTCYCVGQQTLYALNSSGITNWSCYLAALWPGTGDIFSSPVIGADGTVYIAASPYLWAINGGSPPQQSPWAMFRRDPTHNARAIQRALTAPTLQPDGAFAMNLGLDIGRTYEVQASTDFAHWTVLTNFASTSSTTQFFDQEAPKFPQRFYRLSVPETSGAK